MHGVFFGMDRSNGPRSESLNDVLATWTFYPQWGHYLTVSL